MLRTCSCCVPFSYNLCTPEESSGRRRKDLAPFPNLDSLISEAASHIRNRYVKYIMRPVLQGATKIRMANPPATQLSVQLPRAWNSSAWQDFPQIIVLSLYQRNHTAPVATDPLRSLEIRSDPVFSSQNQSMAAGCYCTALWPPRMH